MPHLKQNNGRRGIFGADNFMWKGKNAGYVAIHNWLKTNFGKPTHCENLDCFYPRPRAQGVMVKGPPKRFEYALLRGKEYDHERGNFVMLCPSCHQKYDKKIIEINISTAPKPKKSQ